MNAIGCISRPDCKTLLLTTIKGHCNEVINLVFSYVLPLLTNIHNIRTYTHTDVGENKSISPRYKSVSYNCAMILWDCSD